MVAKQNFFNTLLTRYDKWCSTSLNQGKFLNRIADNKHPIIGGNLNNVHNGLCCYPKILNPIINLVIKPPINAINYTIERI